jgi:broad specificity phosphatase PhoE
MTELVVVRHGQTTANAQGLLLGRLDVDLNDVGRAQASALAAALPTPDLVVSSPLRRTQQTAAAFGVDVEVDERWIELDYGAWDGRPADEVPADAWERWRADAAFTPPGGESLAGLTARVHRALDDLVVRTPEQRIVVVTHVSPVKAAAGWALGLGPDVAWRTYVAPASITRIGVVAAASRRSLRSFNETGHLAGLSPA